MELFVRRFDELSLKQLYDIVTLRESVFVVEQKCAYQECDGIDPMAVHLWLEDGGKLLAYLRIFRIDESDVQIGRVVTAVRGMSYGSRILQEGIRVARELYDPDSIVLEAQVQAAGFYDKAGFVREGEPFDEDGIMHTLMRLIIKR